MAVSTILTPTTQPESKSALKKKKAKASSTEVPAASAVSVAPSEAAPSHGVSESSNGDAYESPYIKELYK